MALVRFNPAIVALRGKVGDWVYRHWYHKPVRQRAPDLSHRILSPAQKAHIAQFAVAGKEAPDMLKAHEAVCHRLARATGSSPISVAAWACYHHMPPEKFPRKRRSKR